MKGRYEKINPNVLVLKVKTKNNIKSTSKTRDTEAEDVLPQEKMYCRLQSWQVRYIYLKNIYFSSMKICNYSYSSSSKQTYGD